MVRISKLENVYKDGIQHQNIDEDLERHAQGVDTNTA